MRKSDLRNLAAGLATSFISRNNNDHGYWALGRLYRFANEMKVDCLTFDFMRHNVVPTTSQFDQILYHYSAWLERTTRSINQHDDQIKLATITLNFNVDMKETKAIFRETYGELFRITVFIKAQSEHSITIERYGYCAAHDPHRESRSGNA